MDVLRICRVLNDNPLSQKTLKFDIMQIQIDIGFEQLLTIVRKLPARKLRRLKAEIDQSSSRRSKKSDVNLEALLLNGPTATQRQLEIISANRKAINQWRTK